MAYNTLLIEIKDNILTISLNRPDVRNALNEELISELLDVFQKDAADADVRVVVLKGNGKIFSAGGDLQWMQKSAALTQSQNFEEARKLSKLLETINTLPKPVIGSVHGAALGGGMGLVSVCDTVLASEETRFGFTETKLGLIPAVIGPYVISKTGSSMARSLFLTAEIFSAKRAYEIGLIHQIATSPVELEEKTNKLIQSILTLSPQALKAAKKFVFELNTKPSEEKNNFAARTLAELRATPEAQEGISAFLEKRKPNWIG